MPAAVVTPDAPKSPATGDVDLQSILQAWNEATDRLQLTHEALRQEIRRLSDELEFKNRELARKNRLADLGQMASHIAHEVRNSLVPMKLYLSLLRRRVDRDAGSLDVLDKVSGGFMALEATVTDLLHFSSDREAQRAPVDLAAIVGDVCDALQPQLEAQAIDTNLNACGATRLDADSDMLRRAVLNLVLNALDAMPAGGRLDVAVLEREGNVCIEVADSGPGIEAAHLDRLLEPFFTTKGTGTGLGLAIVDRIAQAHGGEITAANRESGGAVFTLSLPVSNRLENAA